MKRAESSPSERQSHRGSIAAALEAVGEHEKAVETLRAAINDHDLWLAHYFSAVPYDGLRRDARVREMFAMVSRH
jgi:hypothetical protein